MKTKFWETNDISGQDIICPKMNSVFPSITLQEQPSHDEFKKY